MKHLLPLLCLSLLASPLQALLVNHDPWDALLSKYVELNDHQSNVRYAEWKGNPHDREKLQMYLDALSSITERTFDAASEDEQLAFLINAYNAFTIQLVLQHYPLDSLRELTILFFDPWDRDFFELFGSDHCLDDIEDDIFDRFADPRVHFALVNASKGCPPLWPEAYTADKVDFQLVRAAKNFIQDKERNRYDPERKVLRLSKIFRWYDDSFEDSYESVSKFVAPYFGIKDLQYVDIEYEDYDWTLNDA